MEWRHVSSREYAYGSLEIREYRNELVHVFTPRGILSQAERETVYLDSLEQVRSDSFICMLDNRRGQEITITGAHLANFLNVLVEHGIRRIAYVVVSSDPGYADIIKLFKAIAETRNVAVEALATPKIEEAEAFVIATIDRISDKK